MLPLLLMVLVSTMLRSVACLEIQSVELEGGGGEYLEVGSNANYILRCVYSIAYDEQVTQVRWLKFGQPVYTWVINSNPSVHGDLLGLVNLPSSSSESHDLYFNTISYVLAGNYSCEVTTTTTTSSVSYSLHVIDASSGPYICQVDVLRSFINATDSDGDKDAYQIDGASETGVEFEVPECTLVWSMSTPAVYPRPNITCGYYSFDHDDVVYRLPAGLTLHKFTNESWQADFEDTHIQVSDVPMNHRLGCTVRIPGTSFKRVVRAEDDLFVDNLIDASGCPSLVGDGSLGLSVQVEAATPTCRGDVLPADRSGTATATITCPDGHGPVFREDIVESEWPMILTCAENDLGWRTLPEGSERAGQLYNTENLPHCQPGMINGSGRAVQSVGALMTLLMAALLRL